MPAATLRVAVVGAGFAGLAAASLLARDGHQVTVYEKFDHPQPVGAGILLQPSGLAALRVLGIAQAILQRGARIEHLYGVTPRQRPVVDVRYERWQRGSFGLGLHRGVLFDALWQLAIAQGVSVVTGHTVSDLGAMEASHDLVVIADGAGSALRAQTGIACRDRVYPWGALWAVLDDPHNQHGSTLWQWYRGAHEMLGLMPTGQAPGHNMPVVSLFWSVHSDRYAQLQARGFAAFKKQLLALHPGCASLIEPLQSFDDLTWARYHDVVMPHWHARRCVVIGDAAHATSPQLGQGTNLALLDAVALAQCLRTRSIRPSNTDGVANALAQYSRIRHKHLRFYGQASRWLTPAFQSDLRLLPWLRDQFMSLTTNWPVVGRLTLETLVGVRQSWWPGDKLDLP